MNSTSQQSHMLSSEASKLTFHILISILISLGIMKLHNESHYSCFVESTMNNEHFIPAQKSLSRISHGYAGIQTHFACVAGYFC